MRIAIISFSTDQRATMVKHMCASALNITNNEMVVINLRTMCPALWQKKAKTKNTYERTDLGAKQLTTVFNKIKDKFDAFVCFDPALAHYFLPPRDAKGLTNTDKVSGMIMTSNATTGEEHPPFMFIMDPVWTYLRKYKDAERAQKRVQCLFQLRKLWNILVGARNIAKPIKVVMPRTIEQLEWIRDRAAECLLIAADIETTGRATSCIGFAMEHPRLPYTLAVTVPFYENTGIDAGTGEDGRHLYWKDIATSALAHQICADICANDVPKCYHNGSYDMTYQFQDHMPANMFIFDTQHMLHSMFPSLNKKLYQGAAMFLQDYRYWKDDASNAEDDHDGEKTYMPTTVDGMESYWRYNAMDCANTLELCLHILDLWHGDAAQHYPDMKLEYDYVWVNYVREFALQFGPCMYMSMTGMEGSEKRQEAIRNKLSAEALTKGKELRDFIWDPEFNPKSVPQVGKLYYDVLGMPVSKRKGKTTDKRIVQSHADEHPIWEDVINHVVAAKEPANNVSKYGNLPFWKGLLLTNYKAGNTTTGRLASAQHNFKVGTNFQNFPYAMRTFAHAFKGEWLCSADYSQSDSYFVAYESGDKAMMETVSNDKDTHSEHVEFFFGHPYEDVVRGASNKESWVVHAVTGVRQIIKKVSHGTNYDMGGDTMLLNIRKDAAVAMVRALLAGGRGKSLANFCKVPLSNLQEPQRLPKKVLARCCDYAQLLYYKRYPTTLGWKKALVTQATNDNGRIEMFGGTTTVLLEDPRKTPRFAPAAKGQGGTSGNINNAMLRLYYLNDDMWADGFRMSGQVHDELISAVPEGRLDLVERKVRIMETPCQIRERTFTIPVEADISHTWCGTYAVGLDKCKGDPELAAKLIAEKEAKLHKELYT